MSDAERKKVFISYSWDAKERVEEIVEKLYEYGIYAVFDEYDLKPGDDLYKFMEKSVNDDSIDYVLLMCNKLYTDKANNRVGGVGNEATIITPEIYSKSDNNRFIPIILEKNDDGSPCRPYFVQSYLYIDLSNEDTFEDEFEKLIRHIYDKPRNRRPALGKMPHFLDDEIYNYSEIRNITKKVSTSGHCDEHSIIFAVEKLFDEIILDPINNIDEYQNRFEVSKDLRDNIMDFYINNIQNGYNIGNSLTILLERLHNRIFSREDSSIYNEDLGKLFIWELFLSINAVLFTYEKYEDIGKIINHTYFLKKSRYDYINPYQYFEFNHHSIVMEDQIKPNSEHPNLYSLQSDNILNRERSPLITKGNVIKADLILYHIGIITSEDNNKNLWFPRTYIYLKGTIDFWTKLQSKEHCDKVLRLLELSSVDELKKLIIEKIPKIPIKYTQHYRYVPWITDFIELADISKYR